MKDKLSYRISLTAAFTAVALVLGYVELIMSIPYPIPGMKIGLANIATLIVFYVLGPGFAWAVTLIRVLLSAILFGNAYSLMFSAAGGVLSLLIMTLLRKVRAFSISGVSIGGGVAHNIGQIIVAMVVLDSAYVASCLPYLIAAGVISGFIIGLISGIIINKSGRYIGGEL